MKRSFALSALFALASTLPAQAQGGLKKPPSEARAVVMQAVDAMGGRRALAAVKASVLSIDPQGAPIFERHTLRVEGRLMHYASRRKSGAGFDVVVGGGQAFLCDRSKQGAATYVEDLTRKDALEGAYERDVLFMPFLLLKLAKKGAKLDYRGVNSRGHHVIKALVVPDPKAKGERPFTIRLRFDKDAKFLIAAMGVVPLGQDKGKKRYYEYLDYKTIRFGAHKLILPHKISDQRGKGAKPREFKAHWKINPTLSPSMFVRPQVLKKRG
ncbi:MAG: hypothetical protein JKY65_13530 [Planctomycetes bacterium]|nr:hypothetical protein [Planctomycetota bacterium]